MSAPATSELPGLLARTEVSAAQRDEMFALLSRYFDGVTREQFECDLAADVIRDAIPDPIRP